MVDPLSPGGTNRSASTTSPALGLLARGAMGSAWLPWATGDEGYYQ